MRLATIYRRLGRLTQSSQAIQRVIASPAADAHQRAEALALYGRMVVARWQSGFACKSGEEARTTALRRPELEEALKWYLDAVLPGLESPGVGTCGARTRRDAQRARAQAQGDVVRALRQRRRRRTRARRQRDSVSASSRARCSSRSRRIAMRCSARSVPDVEDKSRMELLEADYAFLTVASSQGGGPALSRCARRSADLPHDHGARAARGVLAARRAQRFRGSGARGGRGADGGEAGAGTRRGSADAHLLFTVT
jgi:hypothetical protein